MGAAAGSSGGAPSGDLLDWPPASAWFAAAGTPLAAGERAAIAAYLEGLRLGHLPIERAADWRAAAATAQRPDWQRGWWEAEEAERRRLRAAATAAHGEAPLLAALTAILERGAEPLQHAATAALARAGIADETLARVAAGAAAQAVDQAALARAAGGEDSHPFAVKYRLYRGGRWLLGVFAETCFVL